MAVALLVQQGSRLKARRGVLTTSLGGRPISGARRQYPGPGDCPRQKSGQRPPVGGLGTAPGHILPLPPPLALATGAGPVLPDLGVPGREFVPVGAPRPVGRWAGGGA